MNRAGRWLRTLLMSAMLGWASQAAWVPAPVAANTVEVAAQAQGSRGSAQRRTAELRSVPAFAAGKAPGRTPATSTVQPGGQTRRFVLVVRPYLENCVLLR
jgi:hypothetical protein